MKVDVVSEITIDCPVERVATYAADPDHAPDWYVKIHSAEWKTPPPLRQGSLVTFAARFLGRNLTYTYEVIHYVPAERLVMRTAEGPFPMETTYTWSPHHEVGTAMTLRNRGEPQGFSKVMAPFLSMAMRRANQNDLERLKSIMESPHR